MACENYILVDRCYREFGRVFYNSNYARELIEIADNIDAVDIEAKVKKVIKPGKYLCKDLKETLQQVYTDNGYMRTAKATDINDYYPNSSEPISSGSGKYINVK